jgi:hypothetical protein
MRTLQISIFFVFVSLICVAVQAGTITIFTSDVMVPASPPIVMSPETASNAPPLPCQPNEVVMYGTNGAYCSEVQ